MTISNGLPIAYTRKVLSAQDLALTNEAKAYAKNAYPHLESGSFYSAAHQEFSFLSAENDSYHASILNMRKNQSILTGSVLFTSMFFSNNISISASDAKTEIALSSA